MRSLASTLNVTSLCLSLIVSRFTSITFGPDAMSTVSFGPASTCAVSCASSDPARLHCSR